MRGTIGQRQLNVLILAALTPPGKGIVIADHRLCTAHPTRPSTISDSLYMNMRDQELRAKYPGVMMRSPFAPLTVIACVLGCPAQARSLLDYVGQCVPFARQASGIDIYGDAWTWWDQADGKYERGETPRVGSVIAFSKQSRLPLGHVAVVSRIVEDRVLMLTHANWSRLNGTRGHAEQDVTVFDVSKRNDWSEVKVWYRDAEGLGGTVYQVHGFIYSPRRPRQELTSRTPDYVGALIDAYVPGAGTGAARR